MIKLSINGKTHELSSAPDTPLLWALRDELGLTGTKFGCGKALCGACTVFLDGEPTRACIVPVSTLNGREITTIEGLKGKVADAVRTAWTEVEVAQCGYCQSGQVMSAVALLTRTPSPSAAEVEQAMDGNLCRCATYQRIRQAVSKAAERLA